MATLSNKADEALSLRVAAATADLPSIVGRPDARRLNVLIVDPEEEFQRALVRQVRELGHIATALTSCSDAWAMMQTVTFDVVIIDLETPAISALELARRVRGQRDDAMLIATSHNVTRKNRMGVQLARSNGFARVIHKGATPRSFAREVQVGLADAAGKPARPRGAVLKMVAEADAAEA